MDPLSTLASLIAIAKISGTIISYCYDYRKTFSSAPRDLTRVLNEVTGLRDIIERLMKLVDDKGTSKDGYLLTLEQITGENGPFSRCQSDLESLKVKLEMPLNKRMWFRKRALWPLQKRDVMKSLESIRQTKSIIESALLIDNSLSIIAIRENTRDLRDRALDFQRPLSLTEDTKFRVMLDWLNAGDQSPRYNQMLERRHENTGRWFLVHHDYVVWKATPGLSFWIHGILCSGMWENHTLVGQIHQVPNLRQLRDFSSTIIEDVIQNSSSANELAVAYYFFDFGNEKFGTLEALLRSLIAQISTQAPHIPKSLEQIAQRHFSNTRYGTRMELHTSCVSQPSAKQLTTILRDILAEFEHVYILVDALDESMEVHRVLDFLETTLGWKSKSLHLLITSRSERYIEETLAPIITSQVFIDKTFISEDIRSFIQAKLGHDRSLQRWPQSIRDEIEKTLMDGAYGMFRWVDCQIHVLRDCFTLKDLREALAALPETLVATYTRMLENINRRSYKYALAVLKFLTVSPRPIQLREAVDFLAIDLDAPEGPRFDPDRRLLRAEDILTICSSLVTVSTIVLKREDGSIKATIQELRLAHFSVKEFLVSQFLTPSPSASFNPSVKEDWHAMAARCCLIYLLQFTALLDKNRLQDFPFARYSAQYWIFHTQSSAIENVPKIEDLALRFLSLPGNTYRNWYCLYAPDKPWREIDFSYCEIPLPLYYASVAGLEGLVDRLIQAGADPNCSAGTFGSALQAASYYGHTAIVRTLLSSGARVNLAGGTLGYPLKAAAARGHEEIVRVLLENGAEPDVSTFERGGALLEACQRGDRGIVKLLLASEANPDNYHEKAGGNPVEEATVRNYPEIVSQLLPQAREQTILRGLSAAYRSKSKEMMKLYFNHVPDAALYYAAGLGWEDMVTELLNQGASNCSVIHAGYGMEKTEASALVSAAKGGYESIVRQLIENGADVNAVSNKEFALACAAEHGHISIVKMLLENKADVDAVAEDGDALQRAAFRGHRAIVKMLLEFGANIDQADGLYGGALQGAVMGRQMSLVQFLLDKGANINLQRGYQAYWTGGLDNCGSPLQAAVKQGDVEIIDCLLAKGADIDQMSWKYGSSLSIAASTGNQTILRKLIEAGGNIELDGERRGTPLYFAIEEKQIRSMELLIKAGAKVNTLCGPKNGKKTPLAAAVSEGYEEGIRLLIKSQADVNAMSEFNDSLEPPLHTAAREGSLSIARILLEHGANVNKQIKGGWTALHFAARNGNENIVRLLVEEYSADMSLGLVNGSLAIHSAAASGFLGSLGVIQTLLKLGVDIDVSNHAGRTALHWAVEKERVETVRLLSQLGANVHIKEAETNMTPLDIAKAKLAEKPWHIGIKEIVEVMEN